MCRARFAKAAPLKIGLLVVVTLSAGACEWFSTMSDPAAIQPHEREPWAPPEGSIPLDGEPAFTLTDVDEVLTNPVAADSTSLAMGEAWYNTYCSVCHGVTGLGNGPLSERFPAIPAIATTKVDTMTDPYVYALITQGRGLMPEYSRIPKTARWHIVNYLRTLGRAGDAGVAPRPAAADTTSAATADTATTGGDR